MSTSTSTAPAKQSRNDQRNAALVKARKERAKLSRLITYKPDPNRLLPLERLFIDAYLDCENAKQSAIAAGYSERSAGPQSSILMRRPRIKKAIDDGLALKASRAEVNESYIVLELKRLAAMGSTPLPVMNRKGEAIVNESGEALVLPADGDLALKSLALLAKNTGGFSEKQSIEITGKASPAQALTSVIDLIDTRQPAEGQRLALAPDYAARDRGEATIIDGCVTDDKPLGLTGQNADNDEMTEDVTVAGGGI